MPKNDLAFCSGRSPVPVLAALPLYRDAGRITYFDPDRTWPGSVGAVDPLGDDALCTEPASVLEDGRPIPGNVFVDENARLGIQYCAQGQAIVGPLPASLT
jgi:hypothetical protein